MIPMISTQVHAGTWKMPNVVPIHRLRGSVLGLVGFGRIPQLVVPKAKAFGMMVMAYDPFVPKDVFLVTTLPVRLDPVNFVVVAVVSITICAVAAISPARRADRLEQDRGGDSFDQTQRRHGDGGTRNRRPRPEGCAA